MLQQFLIISIFTDEVAEVWIGRDISRYKAVELIIFQARQPDTNVGALNHSAQPEI